MYSGFSLCPLLLSGREVVFFFQAKDGIRDLTVTGVQTCALPIYALRKSGVKTVWLLGRRGPAEAAYSPAEIEEIGDLSSADLVVDPAEAALDDVSKGELSDPAAKKKTEYVQEHAKKGEGTKERKVRLRFRVSPVELVGENGRVGAMRIEKNKLVDDGRGGVKAVGTGVFETIKVGLVL